MLAPPPQMGLPPDPGWQPGTSTGTITRTVKNTGLGEKTGARLREKREYSACAVRGTCDA